MKNPCLSEQIKAYVNMIELHLYPTATSHRRDPLTVPKWSLPPKGSVFINVDAALFKNPERMGAGVVIRNHKGHCLAARSEVLLAVATPELAEAVAVRRALALAREENLEDIKLASDCLSVVQRINTTSMDRSYLGVVIQDIKKTAALFKACSFVHVPRSLNESAHVLACNSELLGFTIFRNSVPVCIQEILCNDFV
jgi:ribonuclease HI